MSRRLPFVSVLTLIVSGVVAACGGVSVDRTRSDNADLQADSYVQRLQASGPVIVGEPNAGAIVTPTTIPSAPGYPFGFWLESAESQPVAEECYDRMALSCGGGEDKVPIPAERKATMAIVLNGNGTCSDLPAILGEPKIATILAHATYKTLIKNPGVKNWIYTCHMPDLAYGSLRIVTSADPKTIHTGKLDKVMALLKGMLPKDEETRIKVYGYSYGGFEAIRLSLDIVGAALKDVKLTAVATNDPIGNDCNSEQLEKAPCTTFPAQFKEGDLKTIADTGAWAHWYQSSSTMIHSDAVPFKVKPALEKKLSFRLRPGTQDAIVSHTAMMVEPSIMAWFVER